jgi:hypothetical protein
MPIVWIGPESRGLERCGLPWQGRARVDKAGKSSRRKSDRPFLIWPIEPRAPTLPSFGGLSRQGLIHKIISTRGDPPVAGKLNIVAGRLCAYPPKHMICSTDAPCSARSLAAVFLNPWTVSSGEPILTKIRLNALQMAHSPNGRPARLVADGDSGSPLALALQKIEKIKRHAPTRRYASLDRSDVEMRAIEL